MRVLITGGFGFVGSHLAASLLNDKHELFLISRNKSKKRNVKSIIQNVKVEYLDVTDFPKFGTIIKRIKPDAVIHLAGETSHSKSFEDPIHNIDSNAKSTLFILEKIRTNVPKCKFVLGSTFIVVGRPNKLPVNESTPCNPTTIYGANRLASEHYCHIYHQVYGLDTVIFRITNSFGPKEQIMPNKNAINFLIHQAYKGETIPIYNKGKFFRDIIYIDDVIMAIKTIIKKGKSGNLYWISSAHKTWFYQLGKWLEELTNTKVKYIKTPQYTKKVDVGNFVVDNSKLRALGWKPNTSVKVGIQKTLEYFKTK